MADAHQCRRSLHAVTAAVVATGVVVGIRTWEPAPRPHRAVAIGAAALPEYARWSEPPNVPPPTTSASGASRSFATVAPVVPATVPAPTTTATTVAPPAAALVSTVAPVRDDGLPRQGARLTSTTVVVHSEPAGPSTIAIRGTTEFGNPRILPVTALGGDWAQVMLPTRPNGSKGWIRVRDAELVALTDRIDVDLSARTVTWSHEGTVVLSATAGIGSPATPTPTGDSFVTDVLAEDPAGPYGAYVVAIGAHSDAYASFDGGDARIAIHGTDAPASIGADVSNGCLRVAPDALRSLAAGVPLGTPVTISA